jgi:dCMP deaminase
MDIAHVVARRGNCSRRKVAAIIVKDRRIISTGYNGTPRGVKNCFEGGCARCASNVPSGGDLGECICSHAEENSITQAAYHGIAVNGATLYVTLNPCLMCAKMIINAGIREVVYEEEYRFSEQTRALLTEAGVKLRRYRRDVAVNFDRTH